MPKLTIDRISLGMLSNNVYYLSDGYGAILVDPSCKPDRILEWLDGRRVDAIVLTHSHFDHMGAAAELREKLGVPLYASEADAPYVENPDLSNDLHRKTRPCPVDVRVNDGDVVVIGKTSWQVLVTPGHSQGSMCWYCACPCEGGVLDDLGPFAADGGLNVTGVLISGDTLFFQSFGRTDFEGGSYADMMASLRRLGTLPDATLVLPGHGMATSILGERGRVLPL